jgi:hypothetical protein
MVVSDNDFTIIVNDLLGTCQEIYIVLDKYDMDYDEEEIEDALLSINIERCPGCEWWCYSDELIDDDNEVVGCQNCR